MAHARTPSGSEGQLNAGGQKAAPATQPRCPVDLEGGAAAAAAEARPSSSPGSRETPRDGQHAESGLSLEVQPRRASTFGSEAHVLIHLQKTLSIKTSVLRAMPISKVLRGFATILGSSAGKAEDYELSAPVEEIDDFLSHTWSTPRWKKFLTLVLHNNLLPAYVVSVCCAAIASVLVSAGILPPLCTCGAASAGNVSDIALLLHGDAGVGVTCQIVGVATFLIVLLTWHELRLIFSWQTRVVFLDKACVHQTDPELKRQGIESLAGFLSKSQHLVVLYTDVYLQRLWTVYELATFMLSCKRNMHILLVEIATLVIFAVVILHVWLCMVCFLPLYKLSRIDPAHQKLILHVLLDLPRALAVAFIMMRGFKVVEGIFQQLREFDIKTAKCACEADRPLVQSSVEAFVKASEDVPADAEQETALDVFNDIVHRDVPRLMKQSLGPLGIRYKVALMIFLHELFYPMDHVAHGWQTSALGIHFILLITSDVLRAFVMGPLRVAGSAFVARFLVRRCPRWFKLGVIVTAVVSELIWYGISHPLVRMSDVKQHRVPSLVGDCAFQVLLTTVTIAIYSHHGSTDEVACEDELRDGEPAEASMRSHSRSQATAGAEQC